MINGHLQFKDDCHINTAHLIFWNLTVVRGPLAGRSVQTSKDFYLQTFIAQPPKRSCYRRGCMLLSVLHSISRLPHLSRVQYKAAVIRELKTREEEAKARCYIASKALGCVHQALIPPCCGPAAGSLPNDRAYRGTAGLLALVCMDGPS